MPCTILGARMLGQDEVAFMEIANHTVTFQGTKTALTKHDNLCVFDLVAQSAGSKNIPACHILKNHQPLPCVAAESWYKSVSPWNTQRKEFEIFQVGALDVSSLLE